MLHQEESPEKPQYNMQKFSDPAISINFEKVEPLPLYEYGWVGGGGWVVGVSNYDFIFSKRLSADFPHHLSYFRLQWNQQISSNVFN